MSNDTNNFIVLPPVEDIQINRHHLLPKDIDSSMIIVPTVQENNTDRCKVTSSLLNKKIGFIGRFNMGIGAHKAVEISAKSCLDTIEAHAIFDATHNNTGVFAQGKPFSGKAIGKDRIGIKKNIRMMVQLDELTSAIALTKLPPVKSTYKYSTPEASDSEITHGHEKRKKPSVHHNSKAHPKNKKAVRKQKQKSRKNNR